MKVPDFDIKVTVAPGTKDPIDWPKFLKDIPVFPLDVQRQWNRTHLFPRSDIEDAASYLAMGCPRIIGFDNARGHDKSVAHKIMLLEHAQRRGRTLAIQHGGGGPYVYLDGPLTESDFCFTITQGKPMQDKTPTKQFVTHDVPGFEDGHPLILRRGFDPQYGETKGSEFLAARDAENGIKVTVTIPCTPEAFAAHVRVKAVKPPKVEKKA